MNSEQKDSWNGTKYSVGYTNILPVGRLKRLTIRQCIQGGEWAEQSAHQTEESWVYFVSLYVRSSTELYAASRCFGVDIINTSLQLVSMQLTYLFSEIAGHEQYY